MGDADTLVVHGRHPDNGVPRGASLREAIRRTHARGARVISLRTGSFALTDALEAFEPSTSEHPLRSPGPRRIPPRSVPPPPPRTL